MEEGKNTLPCVVKKTYGKQYVCRAFYFRRTAKSLFVVRFFFAVCPIKNALQKSFLPCARNKTHGKNFDARQLLVFP
jgi:hypothetical protein